MRRPAHPDPHHHTLRVELGDRRKVEDLTPDENAGLCTDCVKCCTYLTVQIDPPRAAWEYDQWIWALYHRGVSLYVERPEKWFLHFETVCEHLTAAGRCAIHGRHPALCRDYDPRSCERRQPLAGIVAWFDRGEDLEVWLARRRPAHYDRLLTYRREMPQGPPVADAGRRAAAGLITIREPTPDRVEAQAGGGRIAAGTPAVHRRAFAVRESRARERA